MDRLIFLDDTTPGITRRLLRDKWAYFTPDGKRIREEAEIARLNQVALPPAYRDAWYGPYAPYADAHLLAVGFECARAQAISLPSRLPA
jgi:DNA topoisomerase-1